MCAKKDNETKLCSVELYKHLGIPFLAVFIYKALFSLATEAQARSRTNALHFDSCACARRKHKHNRQNAMRVEAFFTEK